MKPQDHTQPDITAYVMNELDPAAAARMRGLIACSPEARAEYDRIKLAVTALQSGASVPKCALNPRQKETVLAMSQKPGRDTRIELFSRRPRKNHIFSTFFKFAAAACLSIGAYLIGQQMAMRPKLTVSVNEVPTPIVPVSEYQLDSVVPMKSYQKDIDREAAPKKSSGAAETAMVSNVSIPMGLKTTPQNASRDTAGTSRFSLASFIIATDHPHTSIPLRPDLVRPAKTAMNEFAGITFASPMMGNLKAAVDVPEIPRKSVPQPSLVIHSWKAEIASCPWDGARRLMRFVVQIPVDQPGIESSDATYQLAVKFDPAQVQGYRLVTEKHMPPGGGSNLATRFAWYEIVPSRKFAPTREAPVSLGVMEIVQPVAAKDGQPLRLMDRGYLWSEAREDFAFETAMIGFNLLLQGADNIGSLNYQMVLELAEQSRGEDRHGERSNFIRTVEQAQKAAGL